ncbi:PEP-CTERM sorting domain-containing protein [Methylotenera sp. N17]|uniref:PEP-CTERM sorting domain-containing protein n=1 Tax=Methylotenera sp. N17 TaxID=1502761 RepID=UPI0006478494|nr:PEP-CTERM sorting domain-containing protein [Methylotenera sp. N17]
MKKINAYLLSLLLFSSIAQGAVLVDTGTPPGGSGLRVCRENIPDPYCNQSVALKVNLSQATSITDIRSHFSLGTTAGNLTVALYSDVSSLPGEELYHSLLSVEGSNWYGSSNLTWDVDAGNYWVSFEVRDGQYFYGALSTGVPSPLEVAYTRNFGETWLRLVGSDYSAALILEGTPIAAVPEPESYAMILIGLGVIGFATRRRKQAQF